MNRSQIKSSGPGLVSKAPAPGAASAVGPKPPRPRTNASPLKPRAASTRMYGKVDAPAPSPSPFTGDTGDF